MQYFFKTLLSNYIYCGKENIENLTLQIIIPLSLLVSRKKWHNDNIKKIKQLSSRGFKVGHLCKITVQKHLHYFRLSVNVHWTMKMLSCSSLNICLTVWMGLSVKMILMPSYFNKGSSFFVVVCWYCCHIL